LPPTPRGQLAVRINRYLAGETRYKDVDSLGDGILELRVRHGNNHYRVLFMLWGPHCVGLTAFYKNQQQTPASDLSRAKTRAARWREVFGERPRR
jgi:phage-related protein